MKLKVTEVDLLNLNEREVNELLNEIMSLAGGDTLVFKQKEFPRLYELQTLLRGALKSYKNGIHFLSQRE